MKRDARQELTAELAERGLTNIAIARELGVAASTVGKDKKANKAKTVKGSAKGSTTSRDKTGTSDERQIDETVVGDPILNAAERSLATIKAALRTISLEAESLLRSRFGGSLRAALKHHGHPVAVNEREELAPMSEKGPPKMVRVETWPVIADLTAAVADVQARLYTADELDR